ncbi:MAG: hypothetical protein IKO55_06880 [Kiritimatiellae bacterium]|nr:hypothetical protein [Kiritimatiellia bacterium]
MGDYLQKHEIVAHFPHFLMGDQSRTEPRHSNFSSALMGTAGRHVAPGAIVNSAPSVKRASGCWTPSSLIQSEKPSHYTKWRQHRADHSGVKFQKLEFHARICQNGANRPFENLLK